MHARQTSPISRRGAVKTLVIGFNAVTASWVTQAQAHAQADFHGLPSIDGTLHLDEATRTEYADDFGGIVHEQPLAVLKPRSVDDIRHLLRFAGRLGIRVVGRGRGHTVFGQSQVRGGLVIDISTLNEIHRLDGDSIEVDAGIRWNELLKATLERGLMPPALTDFIGQTVGGTLSVGGIGGMTHRHGAQIDNVRELQVVTGGGRLLRCSEHHRRDLFDAVLAGQGQVGIVVRATVELVAAPQRIRIFNLVYFNLAALTAEMQRLMDDQRFEFLEAFAIPQSNGARVYLLQAGSYYRPPAAPDDTALLAGLNDARNFMTIEDRDFSEFANRVQVPFTGAHPWIDLILPQPGIESFVAHVEQTLKPLIAGDRFSILLIPMRTDRFTRPLFRAPTTKFAFGFGILRFMPDDKNAVEQALNYNRSLFDQCRDVGGTHYPISAVRLDRDDWVRHYGAQFARLALAKVRHDPANVLTGGPDLF
jgi:cytokinin dehydrogenase